MADKNSDLYRKFWKNYKAAHPSKKHAQIDNEAGVIWKQLKRSSDFPENVHIEILKWKQKLDDNRRKMNKFWVPKPTSSVRPSKTVSTIHDAQQMNELQPRNLTTSPNSATESSEIISADDQANTDERRRSYSTPAEDKLQREILDLSQDIVHLVSKRDTGLATTQQLQNLEKKRKELKTKQSSLKGLLQSRERQRKKRENDKKIFETDPELASKFKRRNEIGRPRVESSQPELLQAIVDIATFGAAADERRRSETLRSIKTLDELTSALHDQGFNISRNAVYLRLLPKKSNSTEGKRHVVTVPVRLIRALNDSHKSHVDTQFCASTIRYLEEISSIMGPEQVLFISQDDKARVPIGITAANKQAPMIMHVEYRVKLPDHDWVVAERHKLIPSVYGIMTIKPDMLGDYRAVTYSGPTLISIRSGKHCSSTASSHGKDLDSLLSMEEMITHTRDPSGEIKPVVILVVDGGPDENPRYEKVINEACRTFRIHNLDALFIATNAPGRSAFNRVERRMAPLSRELCGVILNHDHFGTHLDERGRTVDQELERENFRHAGETLAEIWGSVVIDGFPTIARYIPPEASERPEEDLPSAEWKQIHVREGHYFLQVVKCNNLLCCSNMRSTYHMVFPRFIPAPLTIQQSTMIACDDTDGRNKFCSLLLRLRLDDRRFRTISGEIPFDAACPSVKELIPSRTCGYCGLYFASVKSVKAHKRNCAGLHPALDGHPFGTPILAQRRNRRPVRIAAQRQRESMVLWASRINDQHIDWFDDEDLVGMEFEENESEVSVSNVIDIPSHMNVPWEPDM